MSKCEQCNKEFKNNAGLGAHNRLKHGITKAGKEVVSPVAPAVNPSKPPSESKGRVRFTSPRSPELGIVVKPTEWMVMQIPGGSKPMQIKGKRADFVAGVFETDDAEIIDYLENVYKDDRWPIFSHRILSKIKDGAV